jgi:DNA modification methylase
MHKLYHGDCLKVLPSLEDFDCIFADPFDNIGLDYDQYDDRMPDAKYVQFLRDLVHWTTRRAPIVWISFNARWTFKLGRICEKFLERNSDWEAKPCVQVFTFGQHRNSDLGNNHRPLWRLKHKDAPLYPEQIKVPSWRERNGDKRAKPGGRVPGDVFDMQYPWPGDVFDYPRVTGNSKQRCDWHPTQLHEELVARCVKLSTKEGGKVLDPFGGTGTTLRVCKTLNRSCTLIELDSNYCEKIRQAHPELIFRKLAA